MPFLIPSPQRLRIALESPWGLKMMALTEPAGFKVLGQWSAGPRHMMNNVRPIQKPEDLAGMKMRVISSPVFIEIFKALGANPVGLDGAEIYLAMQQKTVDGLDIPLVDFVLLKLMEVSKYLSLTAHTIDFYIIAMNKGLWEGFSAEEQGMFNAAMKKSMDYQWMAHTEAGNAALEKLRPLLQVNEVTPEAREAFVKATRPVYQQFEASIGKDVIEQAIKVMNPAA
jgi:C4-dicarboxylate-binding protein DctP